MEDLTQVLFKLVEPMVDDPASVSIKQMPSLDDQEILLYVYAKSDDIARLIGRQGSMATALRKMMSIASLVNDNHISIKFESY
ncbi:MAG: KH domain-containing protein [Erysipelotrichaceae bacterium]|nr:KH domain-containing protein [Erysipelotrichaceae bacterium]